MLAVPKVTSIFVLSLIFVALIALGYFAFKHWKNKFARLPKGHQNATALAQQRAAEINQRFNRSQADSNSAHDEELRRLEAKWGEKVAEGKRTIELVSRQKSLITDQLTNTFQTSDLMPRP